MGDAEDSDHPAPVRRRPWLISAVVALASLGLVGYLLLKDTAAPDDRDLLPVRTPVGAPHNPLAKFFREFDEKAWYQVLTQDEKLPKLEAGQVPEAAAYVKSREKEWEQFQRLLSTDPAIWRWDAVIDSAEPPYHRRWILETVSLIGRSKIFLLTADGQIQEAANAAIALVSAGDRLQRLAEDVRFFDGAIKMMREGEDALALCLKETKDTTLLAQLQDALKTLEPDRSAFTHAFKIDYQTQMGWVRDLASGHLAWRDFAGHSPPWWIEKLFQPNRTVAFDGQLCRPLLKGLAQDWRKAVEGLDDANTFLARARTRGWQRWLNPNMGGAYFLFTRWDRMTKDVVLTVGNVALHRMTISQLALRRYELTHGRLPNKLEELVPAFLPALPLDPYHNLPLRWDAAKKLLYAVGGNGVDDGGNPNEPRNCLNCYDPPLDVVQGYWWR